MGVNPVKYYTKIEDLAVDVRIKQGYVLYIHCPDNVPPDYVMERFEAMHSGLVAMDKEVLDAVSGEDGDGMIEKDGKKFSPVPLPSNVVSLQCIVIPIGLDLENHPELEGLYGLQELSNIELLQWLSYFMHQKDTYEDEDGDVVAEEVESPEEREAHWRGSEASIFESIFNHYDEYQVKTPNQVYDSMQDTDFSDGIAGMDPSAVIDFSALKPSDILKDNDDEDEQRDFDRD